MPEKPTKQQAAEAERKLRAAQDRKRRRAMGKPLALTDAQIEAAATVTAADEELAGRAWDRLAPKPARGLLDATPEG